MSLSLLILRAHRGSSWYLRGSSRTFVDLRGTFVDLRAMSTLNLAGIIEQHVRRRPERVAVVFGEKRITYAALNAWANQIAGGLAASGVRRGHHVALLCPNL